MKPNRYKMRLLLLAWLAAGALACSPANRQPAVAPETGKASPTVAKFLPKQERILLIIGQDLASIAGYAGDESMPTPGGVTTYLAFYNLLARYHPPFGALGEDADGTPIGYDVDWGAGRLNANSAALGYPDSSLVIGLSLAEGNSTHSWQPGGLAAIARGDWDAQIRRLAAFCREIPNPVLLRIGYEFDGAWNRGYGNQARYIAAFRHVVDTMRSAGVDNVAFVWQASASPIDDVIDGGRERIQDWYPGDDYVDWVGLSWFLRSDEKPRGQASQRELADEVVDFARRRSKPVIIAESAPQGYDLQQLTRADSGPLRDGPAGSNRESKRVDDIWQEWFAPFFDYIEANRDAIRAVAYINADWDSQSMWGAPYRQGYWGDSRIQVNPDLRERWLRQVKDDERWLHGGPGLRDQLHGAR